MFYSNEEKAKIVTLVSKASHSIKERSSWRKNKKKWWGLDFGSISHFI